MIKLDEIKKIDELDIIDNAIEKSYLSKSINENIMDEVVEINAEDPNELISNATKLVALQARIGFLINRTKRIIRELEDKIIYYDSKIREAVKKHLDKKNEELVGQGKKIKNITEADIKEKSVIHVNKDENYKKIKNMKDKYDEHLRDLEVISLSLKNKKDVISSIVILINKMMEQGIYVKKVDKDGFKNIN